MLCSSLPSFPTSRPWRRTPPPYLPPFFPRCKYHFPIRPWALSLHPRPKDPPSFLSSFWFPFSTLYTHLFPSSSFESIFFNQLSLFCLCFNAHITFFLPQGQFQSPSPNPLNRTNAQALYPRRADMRHDRRRVNYKKGSLVTSSSRSPGLRSSSLSQLLHRPHLFTSTPYIVFPSLTSSTRHNHAYRLSTSEAPNRCVTEG